MTAEQGKVSRQGEQPGQSDQTKPRRERLYKEPRGPGTVERAQHRWHALFRGSVIMVNGGLR